MHRRAGVILVQLCPREHASGVEMVPIFVVQDKRPKPQVAPSIQNVTSTAKSWILILIGFYLVAARDHHTILPSSSEHTDKVSHLGVGAWTLRYNYV